MGFESNLTKKYSNDQNPGIIGRDKEIELLLLTLLRHEKPNAIITGEPGVGKTSIVHQVAYLIANNLVPEALKGFQLIEINTNSLLAGPGYRGVTEQKFQEVIDSSLSNGRTILFIDEFHTVEHLGEMSNGQTPGFGNTLKPYLTRPDFRLIGATTNREYDTIDDKALLRRFYRINVPEPTDEVVQLIIASCMKHYGAGMVFKKGTIDKVLELSKSMDGYNPDKAKDLTDFICSYAKLKGIATIDSTIIAEFFDRYIMFKAQESGEKLAPALVEDSEN